MTPTVHLRPVAPADLTRAQRQARDKALRHLLGDAARLPRGEEERRG